MRNIRQYTENTIEDAKNMYIGLGSMKNIELALSRVYPVADLGSSFGGEYDLCVGQ